MSDSAFPTRSAATGHRRRRSPRADAFTVRRVRRAVVLPLLLLSGLLGVAFAAWSTAAVALGWLLVGLVCGLTGVALVADRGARTAADAVQTAAEERRTAVLTVVTGAAAAVEKSVAWSADELCRGARPPLPDMQMPQPASATAEIDNALSALQVQAVASLIRVHPELLAKIFEIDHLVTRMRRQVESTAVLGGQSLRSVRQPVPVTTTLRGAISEVVQYPRVVVAAGSVGSELGLPGHVGPDLTHLLAELIENACQCSDPATKVMVRAQRVPNGLAVEVEDRAIPMHPQARAQMNHLLKAPDEVDVSGQVRDGQLGLLVAAKIAQSHGLSVLLQENVTGGTTALVVIPARLLVAISPVGDAGARRRETRPSTLPQRQAAAATAAPAGQVQHPAAVGRPGADRAGQAGPAPDLPRRSRQAGSFPPPREREQAPATAATPGLAAAFRTGIEAGGAAGSPPTPAEQPRP
ncbi:ATP-binding protein [Streptomyces sp. NPDC020403]|uniref:sensor histidine kinase n=1 Tax=unclassified Streptomyces TaxID=2593676 RepID=UPI0033FDA589